jgi:hypothetical protein
MSRLRFLLSLLARGVIGCLAGLGLGLLAITYVSQVTSAAADEPPPPATGIPVDSTLIDIPASTLSYILAALIPVVGGFAIRYIKSENGKVAVMLVLNGLNALLTTATTPGGNAVLSWPLVNNFIISTVISLATLYGFYKRVQIGGEGERRSLDARLKGRAA